MMSSKTFIIIAFVILVSCGKADVKIPAYVIPADSLVDILVDIHTADAYLSIKRRPNTIMEKSEFYASVLKKHNIDKDRFDTTIRFYISNPGPYKLIYEEVIEEFSKLEGQVSLEESEQSKDSVSFVSTQNEFDTVMNIAGRSKFLNKVKTAKERKNRSKAKSDSLK